LKWFMALAVVGLLGAEALSEGAPSCSGAFRMCYGVCRKMAWSAETCSGACSYRQNECMQTGCFKGRGGKLRCGLARQ
jgi:hypothetical protein